MNIHELLNAPASPEVGEALRAWAAQIPDRVTRGDVMLGILTQAEIDLVPKVLHRAVECGVHAALLDLGYWMASPPFGDPDFETALTAFQAAVTHEVPDAKMALVKFAWFSERESIAPEWQTRVYALVEDMVQKQEDLANALYYQGLMVNEGFGTERNPARAYEIQLHAAGRGHRDAFFELFVYFETGNGVEKNPEAAIECVREAAERGHPRAMYNMGAFSALGNRITKDMEAAVTWYRRAADAGNARAALTLGVMYAMGDEIPQDATQAREYLDLAESRGLDVSRYRALVPDSDESDDHHNHVGQTDSALLDSTGQEARFIDCATSRVAFSNLCNLWRSGDSLYASSHQTLTSWNAADPLDIIALGEFPYKQPMYHMSMPDHGKLIAWGPSNERHGMDKVFMLGNASTGDFTLHEEFNPDAQIYAISMQNNRPIAATTRGVMDLRTEGFLFKNDSPFSAKIAIHDLLIHENTLVTSCECDGIRLFYIEPDNQLTFIRHWPTTDRIPTQLSWYEPGKSVLLAGSNKDTVIKLDLSAPDDALSQNVLHTGVKLASSYVVEGRILWAIGRCEKTYAHTLLGIDVGGESPRLAVRHDTGDKDPRETKGLIKFGHHFLVATLSEIRVLALGTKA